MTWLSFFLFLCLPVLGNIGFEYEIPLQQPFGEEFALGERQRQRPFFTGYRGLFDFQYDDDYDGMNLEIVIPPTRLYKGFPLHDAKSTICPALLDLRDAIDLFEEGNEENGLLSVFVPMAGSVFKRSVYSLEFDVPVNSNYLSGHLQVTTGVSAFDFMDLMNEMLIESVYFFPRQSVMKTIHEAVYSSSYSEPLKCLFFFLTQYYIYGNRNELAFPFLKTTFILSSRTNLATILSEMTSLDCLLLKGTTIGSGLQMQVLEFSEKAKPSFELSSFMFKGGLGDKSNQQWVQGPTLLEYCEELENGIDLFAKLDVYQSVSYIDYQTSKEIVFELRGLTDYTAIKKFDSPADAFPLLEAQIKDMYHFFSSWNNGEKLKYSMDMGRDVCINDLEKSLPAFLRFSLILKTNVLGDSTLENYAIPYPPENFPLATGPYGLWDLFFYNSLLSFYFASRRLYPAGIFGSVETYDEASDSMLAFFKSIDENIGLLQPPSDRMIFEIDIPGIFPRQLVPFNVSFTRDSWIKKRAIDFSAMVEVTLPPSELYQVLRSITQDFALQEKQSEFKTYLSEIIVAQCSLQVKIVLLVLAINQKLRNLVVSVGDGVSVLSLSSKDVDLLKSYVIHGRSTSNLPRTGFISFSNAYNGSDLEDFLKDCNVKSKRVSSSIKLMHLNLKGVEKLMKNIRTNLYSDESETWTDVEGRSSILEFPVNLASKQALLLSNS